MEDNAHLTAVKMATLVLRDIVFQCAVLNDHRRIILPEKSDADTDELFGIEIHEILNEDTYTPFIYFGYKGKIEKGYAASALPDYCEAWLKARDRGLLKGDQLRIAKKAEWLIRALAKTGLNGLIDESTGYQSKRGSKNLRNAVAPEFH